jgi:hypothetical protein
MHQHAATVSHAATMNNWKMPQPQQNQQGWLIVSASVTAGNLLLMMPNIIHVGQGEHQGQQNCHWQLLRQYMQYKQYKQRRNTCKRNPSSNSPPHLTGVHAIKHVPLAALRPPTRVDVG